MANTVLLLAMHPDIQEKVFKELHDVFPTQDSEVTKEDLSKLVYLEMVLKESMRLLIVSPIYVRQITGDVTLCKYSLAKCLSELLTYPFQQQMVSRCHRAVK
jgi:cytochrome P450